MRDRRARLARVLVVEDNRVNRLLLCRSVELLGHRVEAVENGRLALAALRAEGGQAERPYDLILLDIGLPEMDGFEVLALLFADPLLRELPVIVTSALEGVANVVRCIELGAEDYLSKPVNPVLLKARINAALEKTRLRDQLREMVRRFATSEVAQDLDSEGFALGGRRVRATVLFCDIRSFTTLVESQTPEDVIELLNTYCTLMFDAISGHGGVVNQMIGDGLMAIFGAPLPLASHERRAVLAAQDMQAMVAQFSAELQAAGKPAIRIGVGIATGEMVAGYTGTQARATYTCIGDTVNLAARLEAHTKEAGRAVLLDGTTQAGLGDDLACESLGVVVFKGKTVGVEVFGLLG